MGQHGLGERNEDGERFENLCAFNKLVIGCTIFPHKHIHKSTWISPEHTTENQIDHICINKKFQRTMEGVRSRRGADIASDHHLVVAKLKLNLEKNWITGQIALQRFNITFLRDTEKLTEFKMALNNKFQTLQDILKEEETNMEDNWKGIKEALTSTCQEVLGLKKHHHKEWFSIETLGKIQGRKNEKKAINNNRIRAKKVQAQSEYIEPNKQVKKSIRADKNRWVEYFEELLNRPAPMNPPDIKSAHTDLLIDIMKTSTSKGKHGTQWTARNQLDDLDFADDLVLLLHTREQIQVKTASVAAVSASVGLKIHKGKTNVLKYNTENIDPITLDGELWKM
ncbi:unnamed protein product [Schistosoma mattheei]|uniref:Uncharacterized protein n=1 Tax=Schistosoma mattheei TaxID=31246 RepID=A0A183PCU4_9TREM|nr:unnamed protein product [Schistosoma mattheei]